MKTFVFFYMKPLTFPQCQFLNTHGNKTDIHSSLKQKGLLLYFPITPTFLILCSPIS